MYIRILNRHKPISKFRRLRVSRNEQNFIIIKQITQTAYIMEILSIFYSNNHYIILNTEYIWVLNKYCRIFYWR